MKYEREKSGVDGSDCITGQKLPGYGRRYFEYDYVDMINQYQKGNPDLEVFVGIPPRIFKENLFGERSPKILEEVIPGVGRKCS